MKFLLHLGKLHCGNTIVEKKEHKTEQRGETFAIDEPVLKTWNKFPSYMDYLLIVDSFEENFINSAG